MASERFEMFVGQVDSRGRVSLTKAGVKAGDHFFVQELSDGRLLLTPAVVITRQEYNALLGYAGVADS